MKRINKIIIFIITVFFKQNSWHRHWVLIHTLKVTYFLILYKKYNMIIAGLLHDIWKPFVATKDKLKFSFSFNWHEEKSYQLIKDIWFISDYTKLIIRYHYLIRWIRKAREKSKRFKIYKKSESQFWHNEYKRQLHIWNSLDKNIKDDLRFFLKCDDLWK